MDCGELPDEYSERTPGGRWHYLELLGQGGLARVYRVRDARTNAQVAVKVLRKQARAVHTFELHREAQWSLTILHSKLNPKYNEEDSKRFARYLEDHSYFSEAVPDGGLRGPLRRTCEGRSFQWESCSQPLRRRPYVVMEFLDGTLLQRLLAGVAPERSPDPSASTALRGVGAATLSLGLRYTILDQLAAACKYLDALGLIHRDLRPCNVLVCNMTTENCDVKVLDLGVTIAADEDLRTNHNEAIFVYHPERVMEGGYDWLPWEVRSGQVNFEWPAHSFDVFSLGVIWLQLIFGRRQARGALAALSSRATWDSVSHSLGAGGLPRGERGSFAVLGMMLGEATARPSPTEVSRALADATAELPGRSSSCQKVSACSSWAIPTKRTAEGVRVCKVGKDRGTIAIAHDAKLCRRNRSASTEGAGPVFPSRAFGGLRAGRHSPSALAKPAAADHHLLKLAEDQLVHMSHRLRGMLEDTKRELQDFACSDAATPDECHFQNRILGLLRSVSACTQQAIGCRRELERRQDH